MIRKTTKSPSEKIVKDIKRATRKQYSSEEKIRIVLDGLRGEDSIAALCRREGISQGVYYKWQCRRGRADRWNGNLSAGDPGASCRGTWVAGHYIRRAGQCAWRHGLVG